MAVIALYGGTFNPPHLGHLRAARAALEQLRPDTMLIVPTSRPPHKELSGDAASDTERLDMLRILFGKLDGAVVSDMEIVRGGVSYTADTLAELTTAYPADEIVLLMGTDMIAHFDTEWKRADWILSNYRVGVFARAEGEEPEILACAEHYRQKYGARIELIHNSAVEISSTELRELLKNRKGPEYTGGELYAYIIKNRLYGAKPDYDWLRERAYAMLKPKRIPHVQGCEQEAVRLAERWGENVDDARTAAILHDCTKRFELNEQLLLCEKYGIITDDTERLNTKLLHAKTGAAVAWSEFGVSERVREAICWHTTGKEDMSLLEKIVYMADYIEPTRDFEGLDELRSLAYEDLDAAVLLGLEMSIEDLERGGIVPHPRTAAAAEWIRRQRQG